MGFHTFDPDRADRLEDEARRYRYCSREELLGGLALDGGETVADLGSGTGFYTDDVAEYLADWANAGGDGGEAGDDGLVYAVDVQEAMHDLYREKGVPGNVSLVTADVGDLPFADDHLDAAFSVDTYHEFADADALAELARVVRPDGRLAVVDWSGTGDGEAGPPVDERFTPEEAADALSTAGFAVDSLVERPETFHVVARVA